MCQTRGLTHRNAIKRTDTSALWVTKSTSTGISTGINHRDPSHEIEADIQAIEKDILEMLKDMSGSTA